jgi:hypothetical protein
VKTSGATLKGRYTSYARICIEMDVLRALPQDISLELGMRNGSQTKIMNRSPSDVEDIMNMAI